MDSLKETLQAEFDQLKMKHPEKTNRQIKELAKSNLTRRNKKKKEKRKKKVQSVVEAVDQPRSSGSASPLFTSTQPVLPIPHMVYKRTWYLPKPLTADLQDKFTPYQGPKKCYGEYACPKCKSSNSRTNMGQNCIKCQIPVYPRKQSSREVSSHPQPPAHSGSTSHNQQILIANKVIECQEKRIECLRSQLNDRMVQDQNDNRKYNQILLP